MALTVNLVVLTLALAVGVQSFNPKTADWKKLYSAWPTPINKYLPGTNLQLKFACLSAFALCSFANCSINYKTTPQIAECGCVPVTPAVFPPGFPFNTGNSVTILNKTLQEETVAVCTRKNYSCAAPQNYNTAPVCEQMQPGCETNGKAQMYGGKFDLISTYNPQAWPNITSTGYLKTCTGTPHGATAVCDAAGCLYKKSWNGLPLTCYCPVFEDLPASTKWVLNAVVNQSGFSCTGQKVNGKLKYVQSGL